MAIKFEFYRTPNTAGTSKKRYYARVVNFRHVDTDTLAHNIQHRCTLTVADIRAVLVSLGEELAWHLKDGERVHVEGLGYFQVTLKCPETKTPKETRSKDVKIRTIRFRPDKYLLERMSNVEMERSDVRPHSSKCSDEKLDKLLADYFSREAVLSRQKLEDLCGFTRSTAFRVLKRLIESGQIKNVGSRTHPVYVPGKGYFGR